MIKKDEISNPDSCLNKANDNEILFILLARDPAAANTIRYWAFERVRIRKNAITDKKIVNALRTADKIDQENKENTCQKPEQST